MSSISEPKFSPGDIVLYRGDTNCYGVVTKAKAIEDETDHDGVFYLHSYYVVWGPETRMREGWQLEFSLVYSEEIIKDLISRLTKLRETLKKTDRWLDSVNVETVLSKPAEINQ